MEQPTNQKPVNTRIVADVFAWDRQFETGISEIDGQHRKLFQLINRLGQVLAIETSADSFIKSLFAVFDELADYVEYHFRFEEDLMSRYPGTGNHEADHKLAHADFVRHVSEARLAANDHPAEVTGRVLTFLSKWLMHHIVGTDMQMAKKIQALQSGLTEEEATRQAAMSMQDATGALLHAMNRLYDNLATRTLDLLDAKRSLDQEIAVRRQTEIELRKLSRAVEHSPVSIFITDVNGNFEYVNPKFSQHTGYRIEELTGKTPRVLKSGNMPESLYEKLWNEISSGREWHGELQNRTKSAELYWDYCAISPVFDVSGDITHFVSIQEDITDRKLTEEKLHQQMQFSDDIINNLPGIFYMLDSAGRFIRVNPQFLAVTGYSQAELDHMTALDMFTGADQLLIKQRMLEVFEKGDSWAEADLLVKSGHRLPYYFTGHLTSIDNQAYLVGLGTDIAERRALEQKLVHQARTDTLTGLSNRRHFIELADQELTRAKRYDKWLSILMLDLDEFKAINDAHGHQIGDKVLVKASQVLSATLRSIDIVGRIGGEEFAIMLPETDGIQAAEVAERLRANIAGTSIQLNKGKSLSVTASIGIATGKTRNTTLDHVLSLADSAMYEAKRAGRNRVCSTQIR
jgi:diguanylate cyclase (GGDEF)-like protein/hemerythrin-like metal-binding protein/PAS domain S-box-containing protein